MIFLIGLKFNYTTAKSKVLILMILAQFNNFFSLKIENATLFYSAIA
jgi:hypothetical protein